MYLEIKWHAVVKSNSLTSASHQQSSPVAWSTPRTSARTWRWFGHGQASPHTCYLFSPLTSKHCPGLVFSHLLKAWLSVTIVHLLIGNLAADWIIRNLLFSCSSRPKNRTRDPMAMAGANSKEAWDLSLAPCHAPWSSNLAPISMATSWRTALVWLPRSAMHKSAFSKSWVKDFPCKREWSTLAEGSM